MDRIKVSLEYHFSGIVVKFMRTDTLYIISFY
jgi:hypothetical protein